MTFMERALAGEFDSPGDSYQGDIAAVSAAFLAEHVAAVAEFGEPHEFTSDWTQRFGMSERELLLVWASWEDWPACSPTTTKCSQALPYIVERRREEARLRALANPPFARAEFANHARENERLRTENAKLRELVEEAASWCEEIQHAGYAVPASQESEFTAHWTKLQEAT